MFSNKSLFLTNVKLYKMTLGIYLKENTCEIIYYIFAAISSVFSTLFFLSSFYRFIWIFFNILSQCIVFFNFGGHSLLLKYKFCHGISTQYLHAMYSIFYQSCTTSLQ